LRERFGKIWLGYLPSWLLISQNLNRFVLCKDGGKKPLHVRWLEIGKKEKEKSGVIWCDGVFFSLSFLFLLIFLIIFNF